jgi:xanthosine phosphorylase
MTDAAIQAGEQIGQAFNGLRPTVGLVLGSGLGDFVDHLEQSQAFDYGDLPGFPQPGVEGHSGRLVAGRINGTDVACLQGRVHVYEGQPFQAMQTPIRTLKQLGCDTLVVTNAAGSLVTDVSPGDLMMITDHINLLGGNPLMGDNDDRFGPRFFAMDGAYDAGLQTLMRKAAEDLDITLWEGTYLAYTGPSFETPAEIRAFRTWGADAVGMSTAPEVILARHCGMRVAGLSILTNLAAGLSETELSHEQTLHFAGLAAKNVERLLHAFLGSLNHEH